MVPFPVPDGVTVHQDWLLETVHAELDITVKGVVPAKAATDWLEGVTVSAGIQFKKQNVISLVVVFSVIVLSG